MLEWQIYHVWNKIMNVHTCRELTIYVWSYWLNYQASELWLQFVLHARTHGKHIWCSCTHMHVHTHTKGNLVYFIDCNLDHTFLDCAVSTYIWLHRNGHTGLQQLHRYSQTSVTGVLYNQITTNNCSSIVIKTLWLYPCCCYCFQRYRQII